jgi:hypothetical protein
LDDRKPIITSVGASPRQARALLEALRGDEPPGFADEFGASFMDVYQDRSRTAEVLAYFGIHVSEEALPEGEIIVPDPEEIDKALAEIDEDIERPPPHRGFSLWPWDPDGPPPHSLPFVHVFSVALDRAAKRHSQS